MYKNEAGRREGTLEKVGRQTAHRISPGWRKKGGCLACLVMGLLVSFLPEAWSSPVTSEQARTVVNGWRTRAARPLQKKLGQEFLGEETFNGEDGTPLYYVIYLKPTGYVIVPADDQVEPIIGFSSHGRYDPSPANPLAALVTRDVAGRVHFVRAGKINAKQSTIPDRDHSPSVKWTRLMGTGTSPNAVALGTLSDIRVAPLIQSQWDQGNVGLYPCYNYYTPNNDPCGCMATSMAQIMRYYQYPSAGIGVHAFTITVNNLSRTVSTRGGNGAGGPYDWTDMPLLPGPMMLDIQMQAIGALCYDAGVSVKMSYAPSGSGAFMEDARYSFQNTFGYGNAVYGFNQGNDLGSALIQMLNPNLDAGLPVNLGIGNYSNEGHAVVADGYGYDLATLYHHLNMGWSGTDDTWYNLPNIGTNYNFSLVDGCIYNIFVAGAGEIISGRVLDNATAGPIQGATVTALTSDGKTYTATSANTGIYALAKVSPGTTFTVSVTKSGYTFVPQTVTTGTSADKTATSGNRWGIDFMGTAQHTLAVADNATTPEDTAVSIPVLANDDTSTGPLTITSFTQGAHGTVTMTSDAALTYTPALHYSGTDTFTYTVSNGTLTDSATVSVKVTAISGPPVAVADQVTVTANQTSNINVLANDSDPNNNPLSLVSVAPPLHGITTLSPDHQTILYTPVTDYNGTDQFAYTISNGTSTAAATVFVTVVPPSSYSLTTRVNGPGRIAPASGFFTAETQVPLLATPSPGNQVTRWQGTDNDSSTDPANTVTIRSNTTVTVDFGPIEYALTMTVTGGHGTLWPTGGTYPINTIVPLTAHPDSGYHVKKWTGTDHDTSVADTNTVTVTRANQQVTVEFETIPTAVVSPTPPNSGSQSTPSLPSAPGCGLFGAETLVVILLVLAQVLHFRFFPAPSGNFFQ